MENQTQKAIHDKGFNIISPPSEYVNTVDSYGKIKVGTKSLDDAVLLLGNLRKADRRLFDKDIVLKALFERDYPLLREISNYFYSVSGIY